MKFISYPHRLFLVIGLTIVGSFTISAVIISVNWNIFFISLPLCVIFSTFIISKYSIIYEIANDSIIIRQLCKVYVVKNNEILCIKKTNNYTKTLQKPVYTIILKGDKKIKKYILTFSNMEANSIIIYSGMFKVIEESVID